MASRETENNTYAKFSGDKQRALWYVMVFSGVVNSTRASARAPLCHISLRPLQKINVRPCLHRVGNPGQAGRIHHPRKRVLDEICCLDSSTLIAG